MCFDDNLLQESVDYPTEASLLSQISAFQPQFSHRDVQRLEAEPITQTQRFCGYSHFRRINQVSHLNWEFDNNLVFPCLQFLLIRSYFADRHQRDEPSWHDSRPFS